MNASRTADCGGRPNVLKACRPRYSAAQGKSDPGDAFVLADVLRTDGHRFRPLRPLSDETRALRAPVRTRDDLVTERVALANQLRALLESFWPGAATIFADVDSPIALAFLDRSLTAAQTRPPLPKGPKGEAMARCRSPLIANGHGSLTAAQTRPPLPKGPKGEAMARCRSPLIANGHGSLTAAQTRPPLPKGPKGEAMARCRSPLIANGPLK
jgi:transposase